MDIKKMGNFLKLLRKEKGMTQEQLAQMLNRRFVDMDEEIVKAAGKSITEIFDEEGEEVFRTLETQVLREFAPQSGLIIATGGGVVTRERNLPLLRKNSRIVRLVRPIEELPSDGRPLSQKFTPSRLAIEREPLYNAWQEITLDVTEPVETAERIIKEAGL